MQSTRMARRDGLYLLLLGSAVMIALGVALELNASAPLLDFRSVYYPARCLLQHGDPYRESDVWRVYQAEGEYGSRDTGKERLMVTRYLYPPSAFILTVPFAVLPWIPAEILWSVFIVGTLVFAALLAWNLGADYAPLLSGTLVALLLANSEILVMMGMCAGIAISLGVIAVWCFVREKFVPLGVLCLAVGLAVKPQDTGVVWLYLLLAGGAYRKRALQSLFAVFVLCLPMLLWIWRSSPSWIQELRANIAYLSTKGGIIDPGPGSAAAHGLSAVISLQSIISLFRDDPRIYNPLAYLVCVPLLLVWGVVTVRSRTTTAQVWLGLAAVTSLSMLPIYHRQYDAKLLLLAVPACAMLWAEGRLVGRLAVLMTTGAPLVTGDLSSAVYLGVIHGLHQPGKGLPGSLLITAQVVLPPLVLLATGCFYLRVYAQRGRETREAVSAGLHQGI